MYLGFIHVIRISFNCHLNNWWVNFSTYTYILKYLFTVMPSSCLYVFSTFYSHFFLFHTIIFVYLFTGNWFLILSYFTFFWQLPVLLCVYDTTMFVRAYTHVQHSFDIFKTNVSFLRYYPSMFAYRESFVCICVCL